jgi:septum formation protein
MRARRSKKQLGYPSLILASASPRRRELLEDMGVAFRVVVSDAPEANPAHLTPAETALWNALRKAMTVAFKQPRELILGADTVVCLENRIFGKPADYADAERMLAQLQGREHLVITGVCLLRRVPPWKALFTETTRVKFRPLSRPQIRSYLRRVNPLDKAGAYAIQEHGDRVVAGIAGSYSNVMGLPVEKLGDCLARRCFKPVRR